MKSTRLENIQLNFNLMLHIVHKIMSALLYKQVLDDELLDTLFYEVQSIVNGMPLTTV